MRYIELTQALFEANLKQKEEELYVLYVQPEKFQPKDAMIIYAIPVDNVAEQFEEWDAYLQEIDAKYALDNNAIKESKGVPVGRVSKNRLREFSLEQSDELNVTLSERQYKVMEKALNAVANTDHKLRVSNRNLLMLKSAPQHYNQRFLSISPKGEVVLSTREKTKEGTDLNATDTFIKEATDAGWDIKDFKKTCDFDVFKQEYEESEE